jgi:hypothetical protein
MNSAQRRKALREHPYVVKMYASGSYNYYKHDKNVVDAIKWCKKKCKTGNWSTNSEWDHTEFKFSEHRDATVFALRWL